MIGQIRFGESGGPVHYFIRIRPDSSQIIPSYLAAYLNSSVGQLQVERLNTGAIQTNLTIPAIENIVILIPPITVQSHIANLVHQSYQSRQKAKGLLEEAKQIVEQLIETGN